MSEWWTYTLSDFLLFSPRTYYRLVEIYNAAIWPAQIVAAALGLAIAWLLARGDMPRGRRAVAGILAGCWLFVAVAFHARRYATINWAAVYFAWAFGLEAAMLLWAGIVRDSFQFNSPAGLPGRSGRALFLFALLMMPLAGPILGRGWKSVETFGTSPDATAVATLGILLFATVGRRWILMTIPALWCAVSGATLLAMKSPDAAIAPLAALLAVTLAFAQSRSRSHTPRRSES